MPVRQTVRDVLASQNEIPLVDVRSEGEFFQGHVPNAVSMPLFTNEERAVVGTLYKHEGRNRALLRGLEFVGPKLSALAEKGQALAKDGQIAVHCWRGGMRSSSVAWLFEQVGLKVFVLEGGYKSYRRLCGELFRAPWNLKILGGRTGSQKTKLLRAAREEGVQAVDLEALANHRGSAFGAMAPIAAAAHRADGQPTQEQFENLLGHALHKQNPTKPLWLEDESRLIGRVHIPDALWLQMRAAPILVVEATFDERVRFLVHEYPLEKEKYLKSLDAIRKRLGDARYRTAHAALDTGDTKLFCETVLDYYDRAYDFGLKKRSTVHTERVRQEDVVKKILSI